MEEMQPQDIEDLLEELEEEGGTQESPLPDVQRLVHVLKTGGLYLDRQAAAEELGKVGASRPRIIRELTAAKKSDTSPEVRRAAARALQAPVHQEFLKRHPNLEEADRVWAKALDPEEVELLLPILQSGSSTLARQEAAAQLGSVETSSPQIVRALKQAQDTDPHPEVRRAAERSLRAPVHVEFVEQHPDVLEVAATDQQQPTDSVRARPRPEEGGKKALVSGLFHDRRWKWAALYLLILITATSLAFAGSDAWAWPVLVAAGVWFAGAVLGLIVLRQKGYRVLGTLGALLDLFGSVGSLAGLLILLGLAILVGPLIFLIAMLINPRDVRVGDGQRPARAREVVLKKSGPGGKVERGSDCPRCGAWNVLDSDRCEECGGALKGAPA